MSDAGALQYEQPVAAISGAIRPLLLIVMVVGVGACASLTEEQVEVRQYARVEFEEEFKAFRRRCAAKGGYIDISASHKVGRDGIPDRHDRYYCAWQK